MTAKPAVYSGPGRTGRCICGHSWEDHHLGMIMNEEWSAPRSNGVVEIYLPQECEYYGSNEDGGLDADGKDHCHRYRDEALPDEHN